MQLHCRGESNAVLVPVEHGVVLAHEHGTQDPESRSRLIRLGDAREAANRAALDRDLAMSSGGGEKRLLMRRPKLKTN